MATSAEPSAILSHLYRTDGSATYSHGGYTVIGSVNGPIEVQRRDELPQEAAVDVIVRPAAGVGGPRERHQESIIQSTLRQIILIQNFPRSLIQITLQITGTPKNASVSDKLLQASSNLGALPALLQTSVLALLSASMPLAVTLTSVCVAVKSDGQSQKIVPQPSLLDFQSADSVHILAFTSHGDLIMAESEGCFALEEWEEVCDVARKLCDDSTSSIDDDEQMRDDDADQNSKSMASFLRSVLEAKIAGDNHWKEGTRIG